MLARHSHVARMADNQEALRVPPPPENPRLSEVFKQADHTRYKTQIHFSDSIATSKTEVPKTCILSEDHQMATAVLAKRTFLLSYGLSHSLFLIFFKSIL